MREGEHAAGLFGPTSIGAKYAKVTKFCNDNHQTHRESRSSGAIMKDAENAEVAEDAEVSGLVFDG